MKPRDPHPPDTPQRQSPAPPAEPRAEPDLPDALTFFVQRRERHAMLAVLRRLDPDRRLALLKALGLKEKFQ